MTTEAPKPPWIDLLPFEAQRDIREASEMRTFSDGDVLHERGKKQWGAHTVVSGRLEALRSAYKRDKFIVRIVYPGESVGLVGLFAKSGAVNTIVARGDVVTEYVSREALREIGAKYPTIYETIIGSIGEFVDHALNWIDFSVSASASEKVIWNLAHLSRFSAPDEDGFVAISISQQEFARMLGLSRQVVNTEFNRLAEKSVVLVAYGKIRVNLARLRSIVEGK